MKAFVFVTITTAVNAFSTIVLQHRKRSLFSVSSTRLSMSETARFSDEMDNDWSSEMQSGDNPCWQDLYDDDCSMESIYAANFIASKWIKSMPCGAGIEDCDMPEALQVPSVKEDGMAAMDVMAFLGLEHKNSPDKPKEATP